MRWRAYFVILAGLVLVPFSLAPAEQTGTLQQRYLEIYLKINDAEHLEKQGDHRGALDDFKDCYAKLARIHNSDPNWETALVVHRLEDCKTKILELEPQAAAQPLPASPAPEPAPAPTTGPAPTATPSAGPQPSAPDYTGTTPAPATPEATGDSEEVSSLKLQLQAVKQELEITKQNLRDSQAQLETYRTQLETVNAQLAAVKNQQSVDDRMGKLLSDNKALTDKLAATQKELESLKSNPRSKVALAQAQLKNLQDQYDASQEANKALQDTTTTLKEQLDQAQADLVAANQKLAAAGTGSPEYETLKRENEIMRDILTRELQEQAHRDMAKRLAQEEFDNLKLKSKVLQEQLDILGSPMTPPTNDQERALLASLKVPPPDVTQPPSDNGFSAPAPGTTPASPDANATTAPAAVPGVTSSTPDANTVAATPPPVTTNTVSATPPAVTSDSTTNEPPVSIVMNNTAPSGDTATPSSTTNAAPAVASAPDPSTNSAPTAPANVTTTTSTTPAVNETPSAPDPNAPIPPTTPPGQASPVTNTVAAATAAASTTDPASTNAPTTTHLPAAQTTYTDTTIQNGGTDPSAPTDPTQYSTKARLPDDMRETAQDAADLFKNQKYDESADKYQSIIEKYPESLYAWSNLGVVRFQQGKYNEALKALQQAVKLSPTDAFSYSNLGIVYYQLNQYENAIDALNSAKALDPNDAKTHNYLGCAESQKGWQEVAEKEFRKAIEIDPNFGDAHFNLALVYATSKPPSLELARREYNRALELGIAKDARLEKLLQEPQP
jgi:Flp pilus assembly protein TadD